MMISAFSSSPRPAAGLTALLPVIAIVQLFAPASAHSQGLADFDHELQRQAERNRERLRQLEQTPQIRPPIPAGVSSSQNALIPNYEKPCHQISTIVLSGDEHNNFPWLPRYSGVTPAGMEDPAIGRCLGTHGIRLAVSRMQHALVEHGFITTHLHLQPQDLTSGTLRIEITPGRIHSLKHGPASNRRAKLRSIMPTTPGALLNLRDVEHGLENLRRLPSVDAKIAIEAAHDSNAEGYSDLTIDYIQGRPIRLTASIDDGGSNTISKHQGTLALAYDNLWELGDLFHFSLTRDLAGGKAGSKSHTLSVHYSLPWRKWLASVDHTRGGYRQSVSGAHQKYLYQGNSRQTWLKINRLAWRSASHKLSVYAQAFLRESRNYIDDTEIEVQRRRTAGWEAGIQHRAYIGSATADTSIMFRRGTGAFGAISAPEQGFGEGTARFKAISIDAYLQWLWGLGEHRLSQSMSLRAQWNRTPLTPDERLSLGGRHSIRGFNGDRALIADRGWVLRNELALLLSGKQLQFYSGLDIGSVGGASRQKLPGRKLAGAALGLRGKHKHTSYDFFASVPLHKPRDMQAPRLATGFSLSHQF